MPHLAQTVSVLFFLVSSWSARAGFTALDDLKDPHLDIAASTMDSVVRMAIPGDSICSGIVISNVGHVLAPIHCFDNCIRARGAFHPIRVSGNPLQWYVETDPQFYNSCQIAFKPNSDLGTEVDHDLTTIEGLGPGRLLANLKMKKTNSPVSFRADVGPKVWNKLRGKGVTVISGDFLVFRTDAFKDRPCVSLDDVDEPQPGEEILSLSYPTVTKRGRALDVVNGRDIYASIGTVANSVLESDSGAIEYYLRRGFRRETIRDTFEGPGIFWTDTDVVPGTSGGAIFNKTKQLVGMTVFSFCSQGQAVVDRTCRNSAANLSTKHIVKFLRERYPEKSKEWFGCKQTMY